MRLPGRRHAVWYIFSENSNCYKGFIRSSSLCCQIPDQESLKAFHKSATEKNKQTIPPTSGSAFKKQHCQYEKSTFNPEKSKMKYYRAVNCKGVEIDLQRSIADYNCHFSGARSWHEALAKITSFSTVEDLNPLVRIEAHF